MERLVLGPGRAGLQIDRLSHVAGWSFGMAAFDRKVERGLYFFVSLGRVVSRLGQVVSLSQIFSVFKGLRPLNRAP